MQKEIVTSRSILLTTIIVVSILFTSCEKKSEQNNEKLDTGATMNTNSQSTTSDALDSSGMPVDSSKTPATTSGK